MSTAAIARWNALPAVSACRAVKGTISTSQAEGRRHVLRNESQSVPIPARPANAKLRPREYLTLPRSRS